MKYNTHKRNTKIFLDGAIWGGGLQLSLCADYIYEVTVTVWERIGKNKITSSQYYYRRALVSPLGQVFLSRFS